jgi:Negative regulator of sigma F
LRGFGAAARFAAGSFGALAYTLHCPELAAPFLGIWYLLGMLIRTAIGAWLGPRLLRGDRAMIGNKRDRRFVLYLESPTLKG